MKFDNYETRNFYDEMFDTNLKPRPSYTLLCEWLNKLGPDELMHRQHAAERALLAMGITFNVYKEGSTEHIFPFDIVPRIIDAWQWDKIERGLQQRIYALNPFINNTC